MYRNTNYIPTCLQIIQITYEYIHTYYIIKSEKYKEINKETFICQYKINSFSLLM